MAAVGSLHSVTFDSFAFVLLSYFVSATSADNDVCVDARDTHNFDVGIFAM